MIDEEEWERTRQILLNAKVKIWFCPVQEHAERRGVVTVEWIDGVAHCTADGCDLTSANVKVAMCTNTFWKDDGTPMACEGALYFKPGDVQAKCVECGAWCGSMVAKYVFGHTSEGTT